ncbi:MAG: CysS/YqeB C-terminal domain-containing protein [Desulforhopalus sp.]
MGILALMGSGEFAATMVVVHKMLLSRYPADRSALFLDTPAGFQLNADQIGANAIKYFRQRVGCRLEIASYKSSTAVSAVDAAVVYRKLRDADYILMGPGSPTYAVNQLSTSRIPEIFVDHIHHGGCLVAASAAALTTGCYTLPVYEIYKAGQPLHWVAGLDLLGAFGLRLIVIPHWNNAEGGTHDTGCCFVGSSRLDKLISLLDEPLPVLGIDEHTACIIDFSSRSFQVCGIGRVLLKHQGRTQYFVSGTTYSLELLQDNDLPPVEPGVDTGSAARSAPRQGGDTDFRGRVHELSGHFNQAMASEDLRGAANELLDLDRIIWQAVASGEGPEAIAQARDIFRDQLAEIGTRQILTRSTLEQKIGPVVKNLLAARQRLRRERQFAAGDQLRDALAAAGIIVEDTGSGFRWNFVEDRDQGSNR